MWKTSFRQGMGPGGMLQQPQILLPGQHPAAGGVDGLLGQGAAFQRLQDLGDLGAVVGGDDEIVPRLQGHHRHGPVGAVRCNCLHGQIIGHHHAVKAQVRPQIERTRSIASLVPPEVTKIFIEPFYTKKTFKSKKAV